MIVVIPFNSKDAKAFAKNLQWMHELDGKTTYRCLLSYPDDTDPEAVERIKKLSDAVFSDVHVFTYPETENHHWPAGANWAWQSVARYIPMVTDSKGNSSPLAKVFPENEPWLWLEADAVPLKPKWLDTLTEEYQRGGKPFMGHIVKEMGHMNGVGIYPNDVARHAIKPFLCVNAAWDVVMREEAIEQTHNANHLIQHCWVLINGNPSHNGDGIVATFRDTGEMRRILDPNAVLFHRCKDGSLIDCLMQTRTDSSAVSTSASVKKAMVAPAPSPDYASEKFPKTEIFIVTYHKDAEFLKYCLYSIREFATGFTGVTVVCPDRDVEVIEPICREWGPPNITLEMFEEAEGKGMIHHQGIKCSADLFCQSDFILHTDSDCIFTEPVTPDDYFKDGKPILLCERYDRFREKYPTILLWKQHSEHALGMECTHETMRRHGTVHPRWLYPLVRARVEKVHGVPFMQYVLSRKPDFPQGISEFNLMGGFAKATVPDSYHWIDVGVHLAPKEKILQSWSHGGLDRPSDTGPFVPETPRQTYKRILGL